MYAQRIAYLASPICAQGHAVDHRLGRFALTLYFEALRTVSCSGALFPTQARCPEASVDYLEQQPLVLLQTCFPVLRVLRKRCGLNINVGA